MNKFLWCNDKLQALVGIETPLGKPFGCIVDCSRKGSAGSQTKVSFSEVCAVSLLYFCWNT